MQRNATQYNSTQFQLRNDSLEDGQSGYTKMIIIRRLDAHIIH